MNARSLTTMLRTIGLALVFVLLAGAVLSVAALAG
jgi:hypothetical protein